MLLPRQPVKGGSAIVNLRRIKRCATTQYKHIIYRSGLLEQRLDRAIAACQRNDDPFRLILCHTGTKMTHVNYEVSCQHYCCFSQLGSRLSPVIKSTKRKPFPQLVQPQR